MNNEKSLTNIDALGFRRLFEKSENIVLTTHINPDGDALGSTLALYSYLRFLNKNVSIIVDATVPSNLNFLPSSELIISYNSELCDSIITSSDLIIICDLNDSKRIRLMEKIVLQSKAIKILIDHHVELREFADYNFIDSSASSTCELVYRIFSVIAKKVLTGGKLTDEGELSRSIATCLLTGILTDTGGFRFNNTTADIFVIAAELVRIGARSDFIYNEVYNTMSLTGLRLLGRAFSDIEPYFDGRLLVMSISQEIFSETGATEDDIDNFSEEILCVRGACVGVLLAEIKERNEVRMSFRSKNGYVVRNIAAIYGGGGHQQAAGARVKNVRIEEIKPILLQQLSELFK